MPIKPTELRRNLYQILDRVLRTGTGAVIDRDEERLEIAPTEVPRRLDRLVSHPGTIACDPEEIVEFDWTGEWASSI